MSTALLLLGLVFTGCDGINNLPETSASSASYSENGVEMNLFSDKEVYKTTDIIQIWATLEYTGADDTVTIWHGDPPIVFSITDGEEFNSVGGVFAVLQSTILNRGEQYQFDYQKSGGWNADAPDADFWENFYAEEDLLLPPGEYTVLVKSEFSLTESVLDSKCGLLCELNIKVEAE